MKCKDTEQIFKNKINGEPSILHEEILNETKNAEEAEDLYNLVYSDDFKQLFGNFENEDSEVNFRNRLDNNGEPLLITNKYNGKKYFIDKYDQKFYFFENKKGLSKLFTTNEVITYAKSLASDYFLNNLEINKETFEIIDQENSKNLEEFIKNSIERDYEYLQEVEDMESNDLGFALEDSINFIEEWKEEVSKVFGAIKINMKNIEEEVDKELQEEDFRGELIRKESFLKSSKDNVNNNIKMMLSLVPNTKENKFNKTGLVSFFDIYSTLNNELSDIVALQGEDLYDLYVEKIEDLATQKSYLNYLLDNYLNNPEFYNDENFKNKFTSAFNLFKNNFLQSEIIKEYNRKTKEDYITYTVKNISEVGSRRNIVIKDWNYNFFIKKLEYSNLIKELNITEAAIKKLNSIEELDKFLSDSVLYELNNLGIDLDLKELNFFLNSRRFKDVDFDIKKENLLNLYDSLTRGITLNKKRLNDKSVDIFGDQSILKELASAKAFFMGNMSDASLYTMGKNKWIYSLPSHLDKLVGNWKKDYRELEKIYNKLDPFQESSFYLKFLLGHVDENNKTLNLEEKERIKLAKERIANLEIGNFNSIQEKGNLQNSVDNKNVTELDSLIDYINKSLSINKSYQKTALAADKSTEYQLHYGVKLQTNARIAKNDNIKVSKGIEDIFFEYFNGEYKRMRNVHEEIDTIEESELVVNYHLGSQNGKKSIIFPFLSIETNEKGEVITPDLVNAIYDQDTGKPLFTDLSNNKEVEKEIRVKLRQFLSKEIKKTGKLLIDNSITRKNSSGIIVNNLISNDIFNFYSKEYGSDSILNIAADLFVNSFISQVEYSKLFTGDVAYYKNPEDYKKRVPATYTDGQYLTRLTTDEKYMNVSIIDSIEHSPFNIKDLPKKLQPLYENTNATDAQAWITPQRWKFLLSKLGKWNKNYNEIYDKILAGESDFSKEEIKSLQPLKGVYFYRDENHKPVFLKYSQAVLIPSVIENTELGKIYDKMITDKNGKKLDYKDQIHEVIAKDGIKVGAINPSKIHTEDGFLDENFTLNKMSIPNAGWKLQQDLPTKGFKPTDVGSQIQKIIFQGLSKYINDTTKDFDFNGETYTARELAEIISTITSDLSNELSEKFRKKYSIENNKIKNEDAFMASLVSQLKERDAPKNIINALEAGIPPSSVPGQYRLFQNVFSSLINKSSVKIQTRGAGFIQMSDFGLNYEESISKKGIRFTNYFKETVDKNDPSSKKLHAPKIVKGENGKDVIKGGGIFLPSSFISNYVKNWRDYSDDQLFGYTNKDNEFVEGIIPKEALENIIGYRIPNQGLASNDVFNIAGILPESMGDTVIPYVGLTTKTGSDFDIDKLYLMIPSLKPIYKKRKKLREYVKKQLRGKTIGETIDNIDFVLNSIEEDNLSASIDPNILANLIFDKTNIENLKFATDEFIEVVLKSKSELATFIKESIVDFDKVEKLEYRKDATENKLIEVYKAVLSNPKVYETLMNPIDIDYIKDDAQSLIALDKPAKLSTFNSLDDISTKLKFMQGKAGLGQNVNQLVDSIMGSINPTNMQLLEDLPLLKSLSKDVNYNKETETILLDKINSTALSNSDIKYYVKEYNKTVKKDKQITEEYFKENLNNLEITNTLTALVNAFVDIAKDSYIIDVNWTTITNNIGFMLTRMGMHPFKVNAFLNQPILKDYVKFKNIKESNIINDKEFLDSKFKVKMIVDTLNLKEISPDINIKEDLEEIINASYFAFNKKYAYNSIKSKINRNIEKKYDISINDKLKNDLINEIIIKGKHISDKFNSNISFSLKNLRENIKNGDFYNNSTILNAFLTLNNGASLLNDSITATKFDVNGKGKDNIDMLMNIIKLNKLANNPIDIANNFALTGIDNKINNTFLKTYLDNSLLLANDIIQNNEKLFPTFTKAALDTYLTFFNKKTERQLEFTNKELLNTLEKDYYTYLLKDFKPFQMSKKEKKKLLNSFPDRFQKMKEKYPDNNVLYNLYNDSITDTFSIVKASFSKKDTELLNIINDDFRELLLIDKQFGEDLIKYAYLTTGFSNKMGNFNDYIPYEWFLQNNFNNYLIEQTAKLESADYSNEFLDLFIKNNYKSIADSSFLKRNEHDLSYNNSIIYLKEEPVQAPLVIEAQYEGFDPAQGYITDYAYYQLKKAQNLKQSYYEIIDNKDIKISKNEIIKQYSEENIQKENQISSSQREGLKKAYEKGFISFTPFANYKVDSNTIIENIKDLRSKNIEEIIIEQKEENIKKIEENIEKNSFQYYEGNIEPTFNTVFVFGSNPEGRHGKGAANIAKNQFGAIQGQGEGLQGSAYALPTKDLRIKENKSLKSISSEDIIKNITKLYEVAKENPKKQFKVAYRNKLNETTLNGYTGEEMINMFNKAGEIPSNIIFSKEWFDTGKLNIKNTKKEGDQLDIFDQPTKEEQNACK